MVLVRCKALRVLSVLSSVMLGEQALGSEKCLDVAIVLAVDSSSSISSDEFDLQKRGIAEAFRNSQVLDAISQAGTVAVSLIYWASEGLPPMETPWYVLQSRQSAAEFATIVERTTRTLAGDTGLGAGFAAAIKKLHDLEICSDRRIINMSGDGRDTLQVRKPRQSPSPLEVRALAEYEGIVVNALTISDEEADLADYYAGNVVTGPGAFVIDATSYDEFAKAIAQKLMREIAPAKSARRGLINTPLSPYLARVQLN